MENKILLETIDKLYETLGNDMDNIRLERVVFGLFFTGLKLSNGKGGLSYTPLKALSGAVCCPSSAAAMPASGKLAGKNVKHFLDDMFSGSALKKTLGIAVINALATTCWSKGKQDKSYVIEKNLDPIDKIEIEKNTHTVVVGALIPYIKMLIKNNRDFSILELDPTTLKPNELKYHVPSERASEVVSIADYLIITGTTLINDTLEGLLEIAKPGAKIIVVGPTVSMMPEAFFRRKVTYVGGVEVTDPDKLLDIISEAGSGYHFFGKYAEKIVISEK